MDKVVCLFVLYFLGMGVEFVLGKVFSKCEFVQALNKSKIIENEWSAWLCAANRESKFNSKLNSSHPSYRLHSGQQGCTPFKFGIFQITSDSCGDVANNDQTCAINVCKQPCTYFLDDELDDDIKCVQDLSQSTDLWQLQWAECTGPQVEKVSFRSLRCHAEGDDSSGSKNLPVVITVSTALIIIVGIIGGVVIWIRYKKTYGGLTLEEIKEFKYGFRGDIPGRSASAKSNCSYNAISQEVSTTEGTFEAGCIPYDKKFEIPASEYYIKTDESIGSGAFGIVFKGTVGGKDVAVKCLKPHATKESLKSLLEEIKLMIYLGRHENIVQFVGASTKFLRKGIVYVFVEYCYLGSLENYLRSNREDFINQIVNDEFVPDQSLEPERYVQTKMDKTPLSSKDLISWAYQISKGMTFLSSKKVIHGDLATRNVLLLDRNMIKISDFGLSRKLYSYCNYIKTKEEPLPWRWMALESLRDMTFSTQSDVWAFGVTLWETFSLGEVPFPGLSWSVDFVEKLTEGLRMAKPRFSNNALYDYAMVLAWHEKPELRPTFSQLTDYFHDLLEHISSQDYKNVTQILLKTKEKTEGMKR